MVTSIFPEISSYCYLWLLTVSNRRRSQGWMKYHLLPWNTYSAYRESKGNSSAWDWEAGHYFLTSRQSEYLSWLLADEWAWRYLLCRLKVVHLSHPLTNQETCLFWSAVQKESFTDGLNKSLYGLQHHMLHVLHKSGLRYLNGVSHDHFVLEVSFPSQDQT